MNIKAVRTNLFEPLVIKESLQESLQQKDADIEEEVQNIKPRAVDKDLPLSRWKILGIILLILGIAASIWLFTRGKKSNTKAIAKLSSQNGYGNMYLR